MKRDIILDERQAKLVLMVLLSVISLALSCTRLMEQTPLQNGTSEFTNNEMFASIRANNIYIFEKTRWKLEIQHDQQVKELVNMFVDAKTPKLEKCAVAYYLGEMHASNAAAVLASNITLFPDVASDHPSVLLSVPAADALLKIGSDSIPSVMLTLENTDDAYAKELSVKLLWRIEGDKDIVRLRLQKALDAQKDPPKQARLQAALKKLSELKQALLN